MSLSYEIIYVYIYSVGKVVGVRFGVSYAADRCRVSRVVLVGCNFPKTFSVTFQIVRMWCVNCFICAVHKRRNRAPCQLCGAWKAWICLANVHYFGCCGRSGGKRMNSGVTNMCKASFVGSEERCRWHGAKRRVRHTKTW